MGWLLCRLGFHDWGVMIIDEGWASRAPLSYCRRGDKVVLHA